MSEAKKNFVLIENAGPVIKLVVEEGTEARLILIKLGDRKRGWMPSQEMFQEFRTQMDNAIQQAKKGEPAPRIITNAFVEVEVIEVTKNSEVVIMSAGDTKAKLLGVERSWIPGWLRKLFA